MLAAMAHPLRRRLLDVLTVHGPATATMIAERTGQTVANVSHHLRVLHGSGLLEEAPELARDRKQRWWRRTSASLRWSSHDFTRDPADTAIAEAAQSLNLDRHTNLVRTWLAAGEDERARWGDSAFSTDRWLHLTPDELRQCAAEITGVLDRWAGRRVPGDGRQRSPVFVFAHGVPARP
ncbi:helix-turn-helix domain-containing protein [Amycolatopsis minnesotensis]|uniref:Helix-turn-helix domain-containing protein n=1 Tax=Amycolatopsis minnesotensis TaxID=337894 RepID=A0ABN2S3E3_9PSEU